MSGPGDVQAQDVEEPGRVGDAVGVLIGADVPDRGDGPGEPSAPARGDLVGLGAGDGGGQRSPDALAWSGSSAGDGLALGWQ